MIRYNFMTPKVIRYLMPTSHPIAVIIPVYNRQVLVLDALMSVARQSLLPHRLIVVDDGSTDQTADIVQGWMDQMALPFACQVIRQPNLGASAARNAGVQMAADCPLLAFLDSDDLWPEDFLQRALEMLLAHPLAVAASTNRVDYDLSQSSRRSVHDLSWVTDNATCHMFEHGSPGTPNTVVRRSAFDAVGGYDTNELCGEDYQLQLRISLLGPWCHIPGDAVSVRRGLQSDTTQAPQLSRMFPDRRLRLARILDHFIHDEAGSQCIPETLWKKRLGRLWFSAGRYALSQCDWATAKLALDHANACLPTHLRTRWFRWRLSRHKIDT